MAHHLPPAARPLLAGAAILLAVTAVTGALSGFDVWHAAAGSYGWLPLAVLAVAVSLFAGGAPPRRAAYLALAATLAYAVATAIGHDTLRSVVAVPTAAALAVFVTAARPARPLSVPRLGMVAALVVLTTLPLLDLLPRVAAVPSITVCAVLAASAAAEWRLLPSDRPATADTWGLAQILLFVTGWLMLVAGTATGGLAMLMAGAVLHGLAVLVVLARLGPGLAATRRRSGGTGAAAALLCLAAYAGLLAHLIAGVAGGRYLERALLPGWLPFAIDHLLLAGAVGAALVAAAAPVADRAERQWSAAGDQS